MVSVDFKNSKGEEDSYYMEPRLNSNLLDIKKKLKDYDEDYVLVIDGREGSGKSVFALQVAKRMDENFNLSRVCMNGEQFKETIYKAKKGQCVLFDEAFTGLSSRSSMSEMNRMLVSLMMQMRQKNLFVIIVLPTFFMLDRYCAIFRSRALIHITKKDKRRKFWVFNHRKKKKVYLEGKQSLSFLKNKTNFNGRFYGKYTIDENAYRRKKSKALEEMEKIPDNDKNKIQRNKIISILKEETNYTTKKLVQLFKREEIELKESAINTIIRNNSVNAVK